MISFMRCFTLRKLLNMNLDFTSRSLHTRQAAGES